MEEQKAGHKAWLNKLKRPFRLVVVDEDTFRELGAIRSTGLTLVLLLAGLAFGLFLIFLLVLSVTPLKYYLPGVGNVQNHPEYIELNRRVVDMEQSMAAQQTYLDQLKIILNAGAEQSNTANTMDDHSRPDSGPQIQGISSSSIPLDRLYFIAPVKGEISQHFSPDTKHYGADMLAPQNTAVRATLEGTVIFADWTLETGNTIVIQHQADLISVYKHNATILKKTGSRVKAGEAIAIIGNTGLLTDGPHLHFELWYRGKPVNPLDYIK